MCSAQDILDVFWAEELAHELSAPVTFLHGWAAALAGGEVADPEDVEIAREECARLRALVAELRRFRLPPILTERLCLATLLNTAVQEHESSNGEGQLRIKRAVPPSLMVDVVPGFAACVLGPLLRAVAAATQVGGQLELRGQLAYDGVVLVLHGEPAAHPLAPDTQPWLAHGHTERALAVAGRIVRAHEGRLQRLDHPGAAVLRLSLPRPRNGLGTAS
jgi:hypothetical protein